MKALILAAGFGTRLAPYTQTLPKPLFTVNNRPVVDGEQGLGQGLGVGGQPRTETCRQYQCFHRLSLRSAARAGRGFPCNSRSGSDLRIR